MTSSQRFLEALGQGPTPMCDDCLGNAAGWATRQSAFSAGTELSRQGLISREKARCARCGRYKTVSQLVTGQLRGEPQKLIIPETAPSVSPDERPWHWEGNIQSTLATYLASEGYQLRQVIDTASKAAGVDIVAERDSQTLWVTVKGYPNGTAKTNAATQSRHWFSHAMFDVARYRTEQPEIDIAVGLPDGFTSYLNLTRKVGWLKSAAPFRFFWVSEDGIVREE